MSDAGFLGEMRAIGVVHFWIREEDVASYRFDGAYGELENA
jgi:hypothetical protein